MKVYQYYVHPKMTSYSDEREDRKKEKQNMKPIRFFGWCYLIYTHHSANFNKEIDEEIADSHLLAVYSSKIQKWKLQTTNQRLTTTTEKSTSTKRLQAGIGLLLTIYSKKKKMCFIIIAPF